MPHKADVPRNKEYSKKAAKSLAAGAQRLGILGTEYGVCTYIKVKRSEWGAALLTKRDRVPYRRCTLWLLDSSDQSFFMREDC